MAFTKELNYIPYFKETYQYLTELDSAQGHFEHALQHNKLAFDYGDSMINIDNATQFVKQQMESEFDKKESLIKAEQEKQNALAAEVFQRKQHSLTFENTKRELFLQKEMQLKAITYEYDKKQALAKTEKEKQQLKFEEELKRKQVQFEFQQK